MVAFSYTTSCKYSRSYTCAGRPLAAEHSEGGTTGGEGGGEGGGGEGGGEGNGGEGGGEGGGGEGGSSAGGGIAWGVWPRGGGAVYRYRNLTTLEVAVG